MSQGDRLLTFLSHSFLREQKKVEWMMRTTLVVCFALSAMGLRLRLLCITILYLVRIVQTKVCCSIKLICTWPTVVGGSRGLRVAFAVSLFCKHIICSDS